MAQEVVSSKDDDPVLEAALSDMSKEGLLDEPGDLSTDDTSQTDTDASAETPAAPVEATGDSLSGKAPDAPAEPEDPLAGTEPFKYTVNGEEKILDGVFSVPGEGLIIPADKIPVLQELAERAENLDRVSREYQTRASDLERLSEWRTKDADGKEQVFQGRDGLLGLQVERATREAAFNVLASIFTPDPKTGQYTRLTDLVTTAPDGQGGYVIVPDQRELNYLLTQSDLAETKAEQAVRQKFGTQTTSTSSPSPQNDFTAQAPQIIEAAAQSGKFDSKVLTEKDKGFLAAQLPRYVRTVTEDDRRMNPNLRVGSPIVDASFTQVVKDRAEMRSEATKQALAAEKAGKFNAGQAKGRQPVQQKVTPAAPVAPAANKSGKPDWDGPLKTALEEMNIPR